jgi:hypothetical protein
MGRCFCGAPFVYGVIMKQVKYSPFEQRILSHIPKNGTKISTTEIAGRVYPPGATPRYARQSVLVGLNSLIDKSDANKEEWEIHKSAHRGAQPTYFWIMPRALSTISEKENIVLEGQG